MHVEELAVAGRLKNFLHYAVQASKQAYGLRYVGMSVPMGLCIYTKLRYKFVFRAFSLLVSLCGCTYLYFTV